jgi:hypothetical protein
MLVTPLPMVQLVRPLQLLKALSPILVTLSGIVMDVNPSHLLKAPEPIVTTLFGIVEDLQPYFNVFVAVSIIALQLFLES